MVLYMSSDVLVNSAIASGSSDCDIKIVQSPSSQEIYLTATVSIGTSPSSSDRLTKFFNQIADILRSMQTTIVGERLFTSRDHLTNVLAARAMAYRELADGVLPSLLVPRDNHDVLALQIHALKGIAPTLLHHDNIPVARTFSYGGYHYLTASGLLANQLSDGPAQTRSIFANIYNLLHQAGGSLFDIARTWIWMENILSWYPQLNQVRNAFFTQQGLLSKPGQMPASTGIGVSPACGQINLDLFATWGKDDAVLRYHKAGKQRSAYEYGSAFARAAQVKTPGGNTIFCSGTAAIDPAGNTCFLDDIPGQVAMTIENVLAVLHDTHCESSDVVQAMAYCKTPEVADHFINHHAQQLSWPCLIMHGDVCRDNLLFEIEVTALSGAQRI